MKKIISVLLILTLAMSLFTFTVSADEAQTVTIARQINFVKDGEAFVTYDEVAGGIIYPIMYKDRTYIPVRFIGEKLGLTVSWDEATQTVSMQEGGEVKESVWYDHGDRTPYEDTAVVADSIKMKYGKYSFNPKEADGTRVYPIMYRDRTYLPARFIASRAGFEVTWDEATQTVGFNTREEVKPVKILFIGNSHTYVNDLPAMFMRLAGENGITVAPTSVTGPARKLYTYIGSTDEISARLDYVTKNDTFDYCVLQDFCYNAAFFPEQTEEGAEYLVNKLKGVADKTYFYASMAYAPGHATLNEFEITSDQMAEKVTDTYDKVGEKLGVPVARVSAVYRDLVAKEMTDTLYVADLDHTTVAGTALAALTIYEKVFGVYPENTKTLGLSDELLEIFKEAVLRNSNK